MKHRFKAKHLIPNKINNNILQCFGSRSTMKNICQHVPIHLSRFLFYLHLHCLMSLPLSSLRAVLTTSTIWKNFSLSKDRAQQCRPEVLDTHPPSSHFLKQDILVIREMTGQRIRAIIFSSRMNTQGLPNCGNTSYGLPLP